MRCLAGGAAAHPHRVFSGSNDRHVRVWDLATVLAGGHGSWWEGPSAVLEDRASLGHPKARGAPTHLSPPSQ